MTIALVGSGGLFTRLGKIGKILLTVNLHQSALVTAFENLNLQCDGTTPPALRNLAAPFILQQPSILANQGSWLGPLVQSMAQQIILTMVLNDNPSQASSLARAVAEVSRQMIASADSVQLSTVAVTATAGSANVGNGVCVVSDIRPFDGLANEMLIPESARLLVQSSSQAQFTGAVGNLADVNNYTWPAGSGSGSLSPIPVTTIGASPILANGDFETFTVANTPDNWTIEAGIAGTQILEDTTQFYTGLASLKFPGNATAARISQVVDTDLQPLTAYAFVLWAMVDTAPAAGVLTIDLTDASGTVLTDAAGTNNARTQSLTGFTGATWTPIVAAFRTGRTVPTGAKLRIRLSTALSTGKNLWIDRAIITPFAQPYSGGPLVALFQGSTAFPALDYFTVATTNNRGGASNNSTWQAEFDRMFNMRSMGLQLPSSGSPTIADSLITT